MTQTVDLPLRPSMRALRIAFVLHLSCLALLIAAQPPTLPLVALASAVGASWLWVRRHAAFGFGTRALVRLVWHGDGSWTLHRADGAQLQAQLLGDSIVRGPWLVLRFGADGAARGLRLICGDELSEESLRRLRARLSAA